MSDLMLFVIPSGNKDLMDFHRTVASFGPGIQYEAVKPKEILTRKIETPWYCYMFDNEWIDEELKEALPILLEQNLDYYILMKKVFIGARLAFFNTTRIFRSKVKLNNGLGIKSPSGFIGTRILDGWILETPREG